MLSLITISSAERNAQIVNHNMLNFDNLRPPHPATGEYSVTDALVIDCWQLSYCFFEWPDYTIFSQAKMSRPAAKTDFNMPEIFNHNHRVIFY